MIVVIVSVCALAALSAKAADARENWGKHCAGCHGSNGDGKTRMGEKLNAKDYTDPKVQAEMKDAEMIKAIKEGFRRGNSSRMKAFGDVLSDDEVKDLVKLIRGFKK